MALMNICFGQQHIPLTLVHLSTVSLPAASSQPDKTVQLKLKILKIHDCPPFSF